MKDRTRQCYLSREFTDIRDGPECVVTVYKIVQKSDIQRL
jgi:hypothetical protein